MITLTTEQAQQIEEALSGWTGSLDEHAVVKIDEALAAIRAARVQEQAEQEPVLWGDDKFAPHERPQKPKECADGCPPLQVCDYCQTAEQTEQEPVAWHHPQCEGQCIACLIEKAVQDAYGTQGRDYMLRHINAAHVRTKDLTDDEIEECVHISDSECTEDACMPWFVEFARAVIAADRENNK